MPAGSPGEDAESSSAGKAESVSSMMTGSAIPAFERKATWQRLSQIHTVAQSAARGVAGPWCLAFGLAVGFSLQPAWANDAGKIEEFGPVQPRIIGGDDAEEGAWPATVALVRNSSQSLFQRQFCGANMINSRWAVTAAHCLYDGFGALISPSSIRVAMGFTDLAKESQAVEVVVANVFSHPQWVGARMTIRSRTNRFSRRY